MDDILEIKVFPMLDTSTGSNKKSSVLIWFILLVLILIVILIVRESYKEQAPIDA